MTKEFATDDNLAFAINQAIGDLQEIVKDLPQGATREQLRETIKRTDSVVYTLISSVDDIERKINKDEKDTNINVNLILFIVFLYKLQLKSFILSDKWK